MRLLPKNLQSAVTSAVKQNNRNSISNPTLDKPPFLKVERPRQYPPTFKGARSQWFWILFASFFILGSIFTNAFRPTSWEFSIEPVVYAVCLILPLTIMFVSYIDMNAKRLGKLPMLYALLHMLIVVSIGIFITTVFSKLMMYWLFDLADTLANFLQTLAISIVMAILTIIVFFVYNQLQYNRISERQQRYQQKLIEQNELLKARLTPHFFFNMLNSMQYLIEVNPKEAELLVRRVSNLYRASFDESREVALLDEIELCKNYLNIEQYRFEDKLTVNWEFPDEDLLYDMVISSRCLQSVIERMIVLVVERTTSPITLTIRIDWINNAVKIAVSTPMPTSGQAEIFANLEDSIDFSVQTEILRHHFGERSLVYAEADHTAISTYITYPLKDVAF